MTACFALVLLTPKDTSGVEGGVEGFFCLLGADEKIYVATDRGFCSTFWRFCTCCNSDNYYSLSEPLGLFPFFSYFSAAFSHRFLKHYSSCFLKSFWGTLLPQISHPRVLPPHCFTWFSYTISGTLSSQYSQYFTFGAHSYVCALKSVEEIWRWQCGHSCFLWNSSSCYSW